MIDQVIMAHGKKLVAIAGATRFTFAARARDGARIGDWTVRFTERTQRDCLLEGELDFIEDVSAA